MSHIAISWPVSFSYIQLLVTPLGGGSEILLAGPTEPQTIAGWRPTASPLDALATLISGATVTWSGPGRGAMRWTLTAPIAFPIEAARLVVADGAPWGMAGTDLAGVVAPDGMSATFAAPYTIGGYWDGGCSRAVLDQPDLHLAVMTAASPFVSAQTTHVHMGESQTRALRWVHVDGAYIAPQYAADPEFAAAAGRLPGDPNGTLWALMRHAGGGGQVFVNVQNRAEFSAVYLADSPAVSDWATRGSRSGRRYDVAMEWRCLS